MNDVFIGRKLEKAHSTQCIKFDYDKPINVAL